MLKQTEKFNDEKISEGRINPEIDRYIHVNESQAKLNSKAIIRKGRLFNKKYQIKYR